MNVFNKLKILALSVWVSGLFLMGALFVPVLFYRSGLSPTTAGMIAGKCFAIQSVLNLGCATIILVVMVLEARTKFGRLSGFWLLLVMTVCLLLGQYAIAPIIEQIKSAAVLAEGGHYGAQFAKWHGISSGLYWLQALSGLILLWQQIPEKSRQR